MVISDAAATARMDALAVVIISKDRRGDAGVEEDSRLFHNKNVLSIKSRMRGGKLAR